MSRQNDNPMRVNDTHFEYSFPQGNKNNSESSVTISYNSGSVTINVSPANEHARQELKGLEAVNNSVLGNKTACCAGENNSFILTAATANPPTDALFMVGHLANTNVLARNAKEKFEQALIEVGHLTRDGQPIGGALAETAVAGLHTARQQANQAKLQVDISHTTTEAMNPAQDKTAVERAVERQTGGRTLA